MELELNMTERSYSDIGGALKLAYHELKLHDADYHHRTSVEVNNKIVDALASLQPATPTAGEPVAWENIAQTLCGVDGNGFLDDCTTTQQKAYEIRAKAVLELIEATGADAVAGDVQSTITLNINDTVKVKLTEIGTARWRGKHNVTRTELEIPLWELMAEFGSGLHMAMTQMYFVDNKIEVVRQC